jgi:hypothetical protein
VPNTPAQDQVLGSLGRAGWTVISVGRPPAETVESYDEDAKKTVRVPKYPPDAELWTISDGQNHTQTTIVQPPPAVGASVAWPTDADGNPTVPSDSRSRGQFTVLEPPKDLPASTTSSKGPTPTEQNEAALNNERTRNATNTKWGRVTDAEKTTLEAKERAEGRQLTLDERNATLAASRENRAVAADERAATAAERAAANSAASNDIARARLQLDATKAAQGEVKSIETDQGTQLVQVKPDGTFNVLHTFPPGVKTTTAQDGTILAIDPANPSNTQVIYSPSKPPELVAGQNPNQGQFLQRDPRTGELTVVPNPLGGQPSEVSGQNGPTILQKMPDGSYRTVPNPAYQSKFQQSLSDYQNGISTLESQLARGEISVDDANSYKDALRKNFDAALQGTTPYDQYKDQQARQQQRMQSGQSLLNQRVASGSGLAQSLLSQAVGIVGNKNFMDPSAVAGFSPFAGAADYVTQLGGGPDVYSQAANAVKAGLGDDPATALLNAATGIGAGAQPAAPGAGAASLPPDSAGLLPAGQAGTVPSNDPRFMGSGSTGGIDPRLLAVDPGAALLAAALGRNAQQLNLGGPPQRGPLFG